MADSSLCESFEHRGFTIEIHYDEDAGSESPRGFGCVCTTMALSHRRYDLPNEIDFDPADHDDLDGLDDIEAYIRREYDVVGFQWVRGYDHGTLHLSTSTAGAFSDPWDSGIAGFIFVTREQQADAGTPDDKINELIDQELDLYDKWANGENYGYVVEDEHGEHVDSCWGFVGGDLDYCKQRAIEEADAEADRREEAAATEAAMEQLPVMLDAGDED